MNRRQVPSAIAMTKITVVAFVVTLAVVSGQTAVDRDTIAKIRAEGIERSQVEPVFNELTVTFQNAPSRST